MNDRAVNQMNDRIAGQSASSSLVLHHVPASVSDLLQGRKTKVRLSDTDLLEPYVLRVWESPEMAPFKEAMDLGAVVEGSPRADDQEVARLCREEARRAHDKVVGSWDLDRCRRALGGVLRRFAASRRDVDSRRASV